MKKIKNSAVNQKDRIVCVALPGELQFYYQAYGSKERLALYKGEDDKAIPFSGSLFTYFRDNGRCMDGRGFSLTIKELYEDRKMYRNPKIGKIFDRLPGMIDYALSANAKEKDYVKHHVESDKIKFDEDRELAA